MDIKVEVPRFTVRVELHGVRHDDHHTESYKSDQYTILHEEMANYGFKREVADRDGTKRKLPPAEYDFEGHFTVEQIMLLVKRATETAIVRIKEPSDLSFSILITKTEVQRWWDNLALVAD